MSDLFAMALPEELPLPEETQKHINLFGIDWNLIFFFFLLVRFMTG